MEHLLQYTKQNGLKWENSRSPFVISLFHDICKSDIRDFVLEGNCYRIVKKHFANHRHAEKSLEMLHPHIDLNLEEKLCIYYHMGEHGDDYGYKKLMEKMTVIYPNIKWTQKADTRAALEGM